MNVFAKRTTLLWLVMLALSGSAVAAEKDHTAYSIAAFSADVTIPLDHRCMGILPIKSQRIDDSLQANGFVLLGLEKPIVLLALDWCEVRNGAYDQWREALAAAAGTTRDRVLVSCLHQHDAPVANHGPALLDGVGLKGELYDTAFHAQCIERVIAALVESLKSPQPVTHIGIGQSKVNEVASSRRIVRPGGQVSRTLPHLGGNSSQNQAAEGEINPYLKTISFFDGDRPLLALHSYATHPMSYYGQGAVSADFVGWPADDVSGRRSGRPNLRRRLQR